MKTTRKDYQQQLNTASKCRFGVGVDIECIDRFRVLNDGEHRLFLERIFTKKEYTYCFLKQDPAPHLAARFCAKEAVVKALASCGIHRISYRDIEVVNTAKGVPRVSMNSQYTMMKAVVSLSHTTDYAIAFAIVSYV